MRFFGLSLRHFASFALEQRQENAVIGVKQRWVWYNEEMAERVRLADLETYVYIDVSNIRACCLLTLGLEINFIKLMSYLKRKYSALREARYYEGIANDDERKRDLFGELEQIGYKIRALERKAYVSPPVYKIFECERCGHRQSIQVARRSVKLKSNVDVFLATDLLKRAYLAKKPVHLILFSCDGDYAEMIREALETNRNVFITVVATPSVKDSRKNTLSTRLKRLKGEVERFYLTDIRDVGGLIFGK